MAPRKRTDVMVEVRERIANRAKRRPPAIARFRFPIVADPATRLPADRKNAKASSHGSRERRSDLSAGRNTGEAN